MVWWQVGTSGFLERFLDVFWLPRWYEGRLARSWCIPPARLGWFFLVQSILVQITGEVSLDIYVYFPRLVLPVATWSLRLGEGHCYPSMQPNPSLNWLAVGCRYEDPPTKIQRLPWVSGQPNAAKLANATSNGIWIHRGWMPRDWRELRLRGSRVSNFSRDATFSKFCSGGSKGATTRFIHLISLEKICISGVVPNCWYVFVQKAARQHI